MIVKVGDDDGGWFFSSEPCRYEGAELRTWQMIDMTDATSAYPTDQTTLRRVHHDTAALVNHHDNDNFIGMLSNRAKIQI